MNDYQLDYIDHLLLNQIVSFGSVNDVVLAKKMHCSRSYLLDHLKQLLFHQYILWEDEHLSLSDKGLHSIITLDISTFGAPSDQLATNKTFHWDFLYIPAPGWDHK